MNNPESFSQIKIKDAFMGADGLALANKNELVLIANQASGIKTNSAFSLITKDDWNSAKVIGRYTLGDIYPTTATIKDNKVYVVHSNLNKLIAAPKNTRNKLHKKATIQQIGIVKR